MTTAWLRVVLPLCCGGGDGDHCLAPGCSGTRGGRGARVCVWGLEEGGFLFYAVWRLNWRYLGCGATTGNVGDRRSLVVPITEILQVFIGKQIVVNVHTSFSDIFVWVGTEQQGKSLPRHNNTGHQSDKRAATYLFSWSPRPRFHHPLSKTAVSRSGPKIETRRRRRREIISESPALHQTWPSSSRQGYHQPIPWASPLPLQPLSCASSPPETRQSISQTPLSSRGFL